MDIHEQICMLINLKKAFNTTSSPFLYDCPIIVSEAPFDLSSTRKQLQNAQTSNNSIQIIHPHPPLLLPSLQVLLHPSPWRRRPFPSDALSIPDALFCVRNIASAGSP